jgi:hypothetical protein
VAEPRGQGFPFEKLHDQERSACVESDVEDLHDANVLDLAGGDRLVEESLDLPLVH